MSRPPFALPVATGRVDAIPDGAAEDAVGGGVGAVLEASGAGDELEGGAGRVEALGGAVVEGKVGVAGQFGEGGDVARFEGVRIEGGGAVEREDGVRADVDHDGGAAMAREAVVRSSQDGCVEGGVDVGSRDVLALVEDDRFIPAEHFEAGASLPREAGVEGGLEADGPEAIARSKQLLRAGGDLLGGVLAGVADHVGGGRAEGMHATLFKPEHGAGHRFDEACRLFDALIGHDAEGDALVGGNGAREGGLDHLFLEAEGDERLDDVVAVEDAAAVEPDDADLQGDGERLAVAVVDGAAGGAAHVAVEDAASAQGGVQQGGRPGDAWGSGGGAGEGDGGGVLKGAKVVCFEADAERDVLISFTVDGHRNGPDGRLLTEEVVGVDEVRAGQGGQGLGGEEGVHREGIARFPGGGVALSDGAGGLRGGGSGGGGRGSSGRRGILARLEEGANTTDHATCDNTQDYRRQKKAA